MFGLAINPSGTLLAASDFYDNTVAVYSLESAKVVKVLTSADLGTLGQEGSTILQELCTEPHVFIIL